MSDGVRVKELWIGGVCVSLLAGGAYYIYSKRPREHLAVCTVATHARATDASKVDEVDEVDSSAIAHLDLAMASASDNELASLVARVAEDQVRRGSCDYTSLDNGPLHPGVSPPQSGWQLPPSLASLARASKEADLLARSLRIPSPHPQAAGAPVHLHGPEGGLVGASVQTRASSQLGSHGACARRRVS
jgi:hypothetical protein